MASMLCCYNKIGVSGKIGSGKSTVARLIAAKLNSGTGKPWKIKAFADSLKYLVCNLFKVPICLGYTKVGKQTVPPMLQQSITHDILPYPITEIDLEYANKYLAEEARYPYTLGKLFQIVGEVFRHINPNYWIMAFEARLAPDEYVIIEDVRYPNEIEWIQRENFGLVCRVERHLTFTVHFAYDRNHQHSSETALDNFTSWDFVIDNNDQDMNKLYDKLAKKLNTFFY